MQEAVLSVQQVVKANSRHRSVNEVFYCPEESQFYSLCLERMVFTRCTPADLLVEFGTGDGSPVINCLLKNNTRAFVHGYELKSSACEIARSRIAEFGLDKCYAIHNKCFFEYASPNASYLIANPPYLPAPDDDLYMPSLHGGKDGATISNRLLDLDYENVMLMLSAYSNPVGTIEFARNRGYKVIDFTIAPLPFGYYSNEPKVRQTIANLQQQGKAFYSDRIYFLAGVLFSKKNDNAIDLSIEFLKVMTVL
jgi:hypothetical protein